MQAIHAAEPLFAWAELEVYPAEQFYARHGFIPSPGDPFHLFFPLDPLRQ